MELPVRMVQLLGKTFFVTWPDGLISMVTVGLDPDGRVMVKIAGQPHRLQSLLDYQSVPAVEVELMYVTRKAGATVKEEA